MEGHTHSSPPAASGTSSATTPAPETSHKAPNYYLVWLFLAVLTVAEVGVAFLSAIPKQVLVIALILMAVWKALLVALYYMHLKFEPRRLWLIVAAPLPLAIILVAVVLLEQW
ncbi:MAG TPA: cytochrome C oxidase subunit IV family protein [Longimicrobiales bacterium]|nr:cytochrome C oxidase subunit IV family protein [Longimicrobiales bacterium]